MNHEELKRSVSAQPMLLTSEQREHLLNCSECSSFVQELQVLEARIEAALQVPVSGVMPKPMRGFSALPFGLAAALTTVAVLLTALLVATPQDALARAVALHMDHEPQALVSEQAVDLPALSAVLAGAHIALLPGGPTVTYVNACQLRGHLTPHLAVHTSNGPVVVLMLPQERIAKRQSFSQLGLHGMLVPMARGSMAVVGSGATDLDEVISLMSSKVRYLD